jgi:hypothetical protein
MDFPPFLERRSAQGFIHGRGQINRRVNNVGPGLSATGLWGATGRERCGFGALSQNILSTGFLNVPARHI